MAVRQWNGAAFAAAGKVSNEDQKQKQQRGKQKMEINERGLVTAASVREARRIVLKPLECETVRHRLATVRRGRVKLGEIAVLGDRQWLRVNPLDFHGSAWIEVE